MLEAIRLYLASPDAKKVTPDGVIGGFVNAFEVWLNKYASFWLERAAGTNTNDLSAAWRIWEASEHTFWDRQRFGPAPGEPGGPALPEPEVTDLFAAGSAR